MTPALLIAALLAADGPEVHLGGAAEVGVGVPFQNGQNGNAGFQFDVRGFADFAVVPRVSLGVSLPFCFGFFGASNAFGSASYTLIDIMPGVRATVAIIDWIRVALDVGLGPSVLVARVDVPIFNTTQTDSQTSFAIRASFGVEIAPPQLGGFMLTVVPVTMHGRFGDNTFSEYRFSVGVGYRH